MTQAPLDTDFAPPYMSFETFRNFVQRLNPQAMPPRIDRSMMVGMAGGTQTALMQVLKQFELIGEYNEVRDPLLRMSRDDDSFVDELREILERFYGEQLAIGRQQGTPAQLAESFSDSGYSGSTLRKAITFFLHAAKAADVSVSPHFRPPKVSPSPTRARRAKPQKVTEATGGSSEGIASPAVESHTIELSSGGTVTVSCTTSFLALTKQDRDFLFELVDRLKGYAEDHAATGASEIAGTDGPH